MFSATVRVGKTPRPSGTRQTRERTGSATLPPRSCCPFTTSRPAVGRNWPLITLSRVDFPAPLAPSSATTSEATVRSTPRSTSIRPYAARTPSSSRAAVVMLHLPFAVAAGSRDVQGAEIGLLHPRVLADLGRGATADHRSEVEHVHVVAGAHHQAHVVLHYQDRPALLGQ